MYLWRRLGLPLALLCAGAVVVNSGVATSGAATPKTPPQATATSAATTGAASTATTGDHSATPAAADTGDFNDEPDSEGRQDRHHRFRQRHRHHADDHDSDIVSLGHSSHLPSGEKADSVVSIFGSSTSDGEAGDVVSVIGNTRVTGPVTDSAVAVLGSVYIDSKVDGDVVAVLGNVTLGPDAEVGGDAVAVLGQVTKDPAAIVHGTVERILDVGVGGISGFGWLDSWVTHCLFYLRPLALAPGLGWAWTLALCLLAFYACLALLFRSSVEQCVHTLESEPGHTALAALIAMLLTPVLLILLCVTVIGIAAVPFVVGALFCMSLFGKAVALAWLGGRVSGRRPGPAGHPAVAILIGGALALVLYIVPVVGFLVYKLLGFFGFGAVVYSLLLHARARRALNGTTPSSGGSGVGPQSAGAAPAGFRPVAATMAGAGWTASAPAATAPGVAAVGAAPESSDAGAVPPFAAPPSYVAPGSAPSAAVPPHITAEMPRAGFWIRMAALLLDVLLIGFLMSLLHPFGDFHLLALAIYGAVMWKLRGTTVGGIVCDLHVVRLDGRPVDWETAIVRALGCFLSLFVVFLGFIWIAFDANNQAWHDKIAGTVVVRAKRVVPLR